MVAPPSDFTPDRGDIIMVELDAKGHEQSGRRPDLVISPAEYNGLTGLCLACPVTSKEKGFPFEVALPAGSRVTGAVLADHVRNLDWRARRARRADRVPNLVLEQVVQRLEALIKV